MIEQLNPFDARILRENGTVNATRPLRELSRTPLEIPTSQIETAPQGAVDAVIILGMGPVEAKLVGTDREVTIGKARMRNNTIAALEMAAHGLVKQDGLIIPSGTATADPEQVEKTFADRTNEQDIRKAMKAPQTDEEKEMVYKTSEAGLMAKLYNRAHAKGGKTGEQLGTEVFVDHAASETLENYIYALNELDDRSREKNGKLFDGSMAVITSRYHIARTMEIARFLGIENLVPLVSQDMLKHFGYKGELLDEDSKQNDTNTRWNEQRWIRTLHQIPEYYFPELALIKDNERFIQTLQHATGMYGEGVLQSLGVTEAVSIENAAELKAQLSKIQRINPVVEDWVKNDFTEVNAAIDAQSTFTQQWLQNNAPVI